jgi:hypothetical protein
MSFGQRIRPMESEGHAISNIGMSKPETVRLVIGPVAETM